MLAGKVSMKVNLKNDNQQGTVADMAVVLLAQRDGIHVAHAANRVAAAAALLAEMWAWFTPTAANVATLTDREWADFAYYAEVKVPAEGTRQLVRELVAAAEAEREAEAERRWGK